MTYSHKKAFSALVTVFSVPDDKLGALRGRVQHYQKTYGVPGNPGRGKSASYTLCDVFRIALEIRLSALGVPQKQTGDILRASDVGGAPDAWVIYRANPFDPWTVVNPGFDLSFVPARVDHITVNTARLKQEVAAALGDVNELRTPLVRA